MDEDLKILIGLDVDTKIKDVEKVQSEIQKNNDLKIKIKASIDTSSSAISELTKEISSISAKISNQLPDIKLGVKVSDIILTNDISAKIENSINQALKKKPISITVADASATLDNLSMGKIEEQIKNLSNIKVKFGEVEGFDAVAKKLNSLGNIISTKLQNLKVNLGEVGAGSKFAPTKDDLQKIQSYYDILNSINKSRARDINKTNFIDPDNEDSYLVKNASTGKLETLNDLYNEIYQSITKINNINKLSADSMQDYIANINTYYTKGGTRFFDDAFKKGQSMIDLLNAASEKLAGKSNIFNETGSINDTANSKSINDLAIAVERLNNAIELTPEKAKAFVASLNSLLDINEEKLSKLNTLANTLASERNRLSQPIEINKAKESQLPDVKSISKENIKTNKTSDDKDNISKAKDEMLKIYRDIQKLKDSLNNTDYSTPFLNQLIQNFADAYTSINASINSIENRIKSLSEILGSDIKSKVFDSLVKDIQETSKQIQEAEQNTTNSLVNNGNTTATKGTVSNNKKAKKSSNKSFSITAAEVKSVSKDIGTLQGTLGSINKVGDQVFDGLQNDLHTLENSFNNLQKSFAGSKIPIEQQAQLYADFRAELQKTKLSIEAYKKQQDALINAQNKANARINTIQQTAKKSKVFDIGDTSYLTEVSDIEKAKQQLNTIKELSSSNILNVTAEKFNSNNEIQKLSVLAENAEGSLEKLSFELKTISDDDSKGLVYAGKTITTLDQEAKKATESLNSLMAAAANKNQFAINDNYLLGDLNNQNDNKKFSSVNQSYLSAIANIQNAANNPSSSYTSLVSVINKETAALKNQLDILQKRNATINSVNKSVLNLSKYINTNSLREKELSNIKDDIQYIDNLSNEKFDLFDEAELAIVQKRLEDIYENFKNLKSQEKYNAFLSNRDADIKSLKADMERLLNNSPKIRKDAGLFNAWETVYNKLNPDYIDSADKMTSVRKEVRALNAEFKELGVTQASFFDKIKVNFSKFTEWFGVSQAVMYAVDSLKNMISVSIELDKQLTNLQIASGYTEDQTKSLLKSYSDLAQNLGSTTSQVSAAADSWLRQGYSIQETNDLITNSMVLSKVGQLESAEATQYLTSAMKGYNVEASNSLDIVDKLSAVDMQAAVSAGGLAEAMSRTASSAQLAGIEMDKLIGYATVIGETTQRSMDTVGESLKSIFARMGQIKAGRLEDPETGEDLSNVETTLGNVGIDLRDSNSEFRNFGEVLDEVGSKWDTYNSVQQRAIANSIAGIHQYENFVVLMENYGKALEYTTIAAESNGTAMEKFNVYQESAEAKINKTTAAFENLSYTTMNTDVLKGTLDFFTGTLNVVEKLVDELGLIPTLLGSISAIATMSNKDAGKLSMPSYWENDIQPIGCRKGA